MKTLDQDSQPQKDYERIATAIRFLIDRNKSSEKTNTLSDLANHLELSDSHCHKLFHRWAGITPKQFQQFLRKEFALQQLQQSANLLDTTLATGLSSPGRLHDLILHWEAITPGQAKARGKGVTIEYAFSFSPYGTMLIATTEKGICHLIFCNDNQEARSFALEELRIRFPQALLNYNQSTIDALAHQLFPAHARTTPVALHLWGSPFQHKVWEALLRLDAGMVTTYGQIATQIHQPSAARAVGTAIGANSIAVLIPCHRVIQQTGLFSGYRWGMERKIALLAQELAAKI